MSKSSGNTIDLFAYDDTVRKQIMSIKTDSSTVAMPKPADSALHRLLELLVPPDYFVALERAGARAARAMRTTSGRCSTIST